VRTLFAPIKASFSTGAARVKLGYTGAHYPEHAAELEGCPTSLGLVPLRLAVATSQLELYRQGLANGAIRSILRYWGAVGDYDQALVEMAAIGFCWLAPQRLGSLTRGSKTNLGLAASDQ